MCRAEQSLTTLESSSMVQSWLIFKEMLIRDANCDRMPLMSCGKSLQMSEYFPKVRE